MLLSRMLVIVLNWLLVPSPNHLAHANRNAGVQYERADDDLTSLWEVSPAVVELVVTNELDATEREHAVKVGQAVPRKPVKSKPSACFTFDVAQRHAVTYSV
ncbi:hypothetical protein LshimejAT787_0112830 [Lyophyllum shimeji]|uniref:Uncharacterized protein n=1 Tax=Lyophyllum shimeji TaxID=47721 RepID=A0A9P3PF47_LYOSH|nr:hypothetical protein LshimejAT787_0112830 [Lyophyllum shimeji]